MPVEMKKVADRNGQRLSVYRKGGYFLKSNRISTGTFSKPRFMTSAL